MGKKKTHEDFVKELNALVGDEYIVLGEYKGALTKILMKHNTCGYEWMIRPSNFLEGRRCPKCQIKANTKSHEEFVQEVESLVNKEYTILGEYKNAQTKILMRHNNCSYIWHVVPFHFLDGSRCPKCTALIRAETRVKTHTKFAQEVKELVGEEYSIIGNYTNTKTKIMIRHNICRNEWMVTPNNFLRGKRCPKCNESKGEKAISNYLKTQGIEYIPQYKINGCKNVNPLPFDFALFDNESNLKLLIEYQGKQHYEPVEWFGGEEGLKYRQQNDSIKANYCKEHNIPLLLNSLYRTQQH